MNKIRVIIAESSRIFCVGLSQILAAEETIEVIGQAHDGQEVIDKASELSPDIILMDAELPGGTRAMQVLQELQPRVKVVVLSAPEKREAAFDIAAKARARSFLLKTATPTELVRVIIETAGGIPAVRPTVIPLVLGKPATAEEGPAAAILLSAGEMEVLAELLEGKTEREIAQALSIPQDAVRAHLRNIMDKLKLQNRNRVEPAGYTAEQ